MIQVSEISVDNRSAIQTLKPLYSQKNADKDNQITCN